MYPSLQMQNTGTLVKHLEAQTKIVQVMEDVKRKTQTCMLAYFPKRFVFLFRVAHSHRQRRRRQGN